jgi:6-phosphogluconate dehydrogenase
MLADIGIFGLGTMGENLCLNLVEKGYKVSIYNAV